jgi:hypothetical protein
MIKPIIYYSYSEKQAVDEAAIVNVPAEKRLAISQALMDIFDESFKNQTGEASKTQKIDQLDILELDKICHKRGKGRSR